jgi:hypothetical protein
MSTEQGFTITDLEIQKIGLLDRIKRLEDDLRCPLEQNFADQSGQISQQLVLMRLLEVEKSTLRKINFEIDKLKQNYLREG